MQFTLETRRTARGRHVDVTLFVDRPVRLPWTARVTRWLRRQPAPAPAQDVSQATFVLVPHRNGRFGWAELGTGLTPTNWLSTRTGELRPGVLEHHIANVAALAEAQGPRTEDERRAGAGGR